MKEKVKGTSLISSKLITAILACIICVLVTSRVYAQDTVIITGDCSADGSSVTYTLYDTDGDGNADKIVISGNGAMKDYDLYLDIPWRDYRTNLKDAVIEEGITNIGAWTFYNCSNLTSVNIPEGVTNIGKFAFWGCSGLTSINIPEGVTNIGVGAFCGCSGLTSITIPEGITSIYGGVFEGCSGLTSINIPEGVTSIYGGAFDGCSSLTSINIPEGVTSIGSFSYCSSLTSINIPEGVTSIEYAAFSNCSSLTSINIPEGVTSIEKEAFYGCSSLTSINIPEGVTSIGNETFKNCKSLTNINIPEKVTSIGKEAFYGCSSLKSITIPESVKYIWSKALGYDKNSSTIDGFIIKGYHDSVAEKYAKENGFTFIDLSSLKCDKDGHLTVYSENASGWQADSTGTLYWYEDGYRMGYDANDDSYRGKEIYDSVSDAWYWLDNVDGGKKAVSKDVYQESKADDEGNIGKWVRYDANGYMVKGWDENEAGRYFFDYTYGTMVKGYYTIDGTEYYFNTDTGVLERTVTDGLSGYTGWKNIDGADFWYEDGKRQGTKADPAYRGKEIFDPESGAWYWLDNVDAGKKAVSKDVYQESLADDAGNIGKWVRYDANGGMIKGWSAGYGADARTIASPSDANGEAVYYFDPKYGTMAKGQVTIDGVTYTFDTDSGILK